MQVKLIKSHNPFFEIYSNICKPIIGKIIAAKKSYGVFKAPTTAKKKIVNTKTNKALKKSIFNLFNLIISQKAKIG